MCLCVGLFLCVHMCVRTCAYMCVCVCMYVRVCICVYMYVCIFVRMCVYVSTCIHVSAFLYRLLRSFSLLAFCIDNNYQNIRVIGPWHILYHLVFDAQSFVKQNTVKMIWYGTQQEL